MGLKGKTTATRIEAASDEVPGDAHPSQLSLPLDFLYLVRGSPESHARVILHAGTIAGVAPGVKRVLTPRAVSRRFVGMILDIIANPDDSDGSHTAVAIESPSIGEVGEPSYLVAPGEVWIAVRRDGKRVATYRVPTDFIMRHFADHARKEAGHFVRERIRLAIDWPGGWEAFPELAYIPVPLDLRPILVDVTK